MDAGGPFSMTCLAAALLTHATLKHYYLENAANAVETYVRDCQGDCQFQCPRSRMLPLFKIPFVFRNAGCDAINEIGRNRQMLTGRPGASDTSIEPLTFPAYQN